MQPTIFAAFTDAADAERAAGALMDHGIKPEEISLIVSKDYHKNQGNPGDPQLEYTHPQTVLREHDALNTIDPMNNQMRDTPVTIDMSVGRNLGPGNELLAGPSHPVPEEDLHNEIEAKRQNSALQAAALRAEPDEGLDVNRVDKDIDEMRDIDRTVGPSVYDPERAAKAGVTTTTIDDAASAAKKGALLGLGVGTLAAVAALAVPGFGLVIGGGALAAAAAGLAATAGAGAVAGGVVGYLKDQGVPGQDIPHYEKAITGGGAVLAVHLEPSSDREHVDQLLRKYGAHATNDYGYAA